MDVTCIERKYKIREHGISYFITAKREFDKELTDKFLHEDMELKTFLEYYEITGFQKDEDFPLKEEISGQLEISDITRHTSSKLSPPPALRREWIILHHMPEEFAMEDIAKFYIDKDENYDIKDLKRKFSSTIRKLRRHHKVETINPDANNRYKKYRLLVIENREYDKMIDDMCKI